MLTESDLIKLNCRVTRERKCKYYFAQSILKIIRLLVSRNESLCNLRPCCPSGELSTFVVACLLFAFPYHDPLWPGMTTFNIVEFNITSNDCRTCVTCD